MRLVPALDRGIRILELVRTSNGISASEVGLSLGLPRSATYELIHTLVESRLLNRREGGKLELGSQLFVLGSAYGASLDLVREANSVAYQVMARCDETVQVAVLEGREVLYVAKADSSQAVRLVSEVGRRLPAHCTALGKVLLSELGTAEINDLFSGVRLEVLTSRSIADTASLQVELGRIRRAGHASEHGEANPGAGCVAAPIRNSTGKCVAAISIAAPLSRLNRKRETDLAELVTAGAMELSQRLGYREARVASLGRR